MSLIYVLLSFLAGVGVLRRGRRFDFITIGFASQQLYFSPLLFQAFGRCGYLGCSSWQVAAFGCILCCLFFVFSFFPVESGRRIQIKNEPDIQDFKFICLLLSFAGFLVLFLSSKGGVLYLPKREMMKFISYDYIVWSISAALGFLFSVYYKDLRWSVLFLLLLLVTVYIGFRSVFAIALISAFALWSKRFCWSFSNFKIKYILFSLVLAFLFFFYKGFYAAIKTGNYELALVRVANYDYFLSIFSKSEPVMTISILSNVMQHDLYIGPSDFARLLAVFSVGMDGLFGDDNFNSIIQPLFYSDFSGGVGSNIWAYFYATSGLLGLLLFSVFYVFSLWLLSRFLMRSSGAVSVLCAFLSAYWAFYIHRNDFIYQLTLEKRVFLIFWIVFFLAVFVKRFRRGHVE